MGMLAPGRQIGAFDECFNRVTRRFFYSHDQSLFYSVFPDKKAGISVTSLSLT
jgi:hypothetical protein